MPEAFVPFIPLVTGGAQAATTIYGAHRSSSANRYAADLSAQGNQAAIHQAQLDRKAQEERDRVEQEYRRQRDEELARQWAAEEKFRLDVFAAQEEQRLYERQVAEYQQRLLEEREARLAPYREASLSALGLLSGRLGFDVPGGAESSGATRLGVPVVSGAAGGRPSGPSTQAPMQQSSASLTPTAPAYAAVTGARPSGNVATGAPPAAPLSLGSVLGVGQGRRPMFTPRRRRAYAA